MDILDKKQLSDFDQEAQKYLSFFELPGHELKIKGSGQYKFLNYRSDYDILISIKDDTPIHKLFNDLRDNLIKIEKEPNTYFIELKLHTKDDHKVRFHHGDNFSFSDFEKYYAKLKFFKIDIIMFIRDKFWEASCVYALSPEPKLTMDKIVKNIKEDIEEYKAEGKYYKVLKRMFSIYVLYKNMGQAEFLIKVFNSDLGKTYEKICNLEAVEIVHSYYKDKDTMEKIDKCLKLLHEKFDLKHIAKQIDKYSEELNDEAEKIYDNMKKDATYP